MHVKGKRGTSHWLVLNVCVALISSFESTEILEKVLKYLNDITGLYFKDEFLLLAYWDTTKQTSLIQGLTKRLFRSNRFSFKVCEAQRSKDGDGQDLARSTVLLLDVADNSSVESQKQNPRNGPCRHRGCPLDSTATYLVVV